MQVGWNLERDICIVLGDKNMSDANFYHMIEDENGVGEGMYDPFEPPFSEDRESPEYSSLNVDSRKPLVKGKCPICGISVFPWEMTPHKNTHRKNKGVN